MGAGTQYTVNNQMVNATLMNIADNPSNVQLPGVYKQETIPRVPIVCTGNRNVKQSCLLVILHAQNIDYVSSHSSNVQLPAASSINLACIKN